MTAKRCLKFACASCRVVALSVAPRSSVAQDAAGGNIAQNRAKSWADTNNGTNPTLLTMQATIRYQYNRITSDLNTGLLEVQFVRPIGNGTKALRFTLPGSDSPFNTRPKLGDAAAADAIEDCVGDEVRLGDISVTFIDVFHLTPKNGAAREANRRPA